MRSLIHSLLLFFSIFFWQDLYSQEETQSAISVTDSTQLSTKRRYNFYVADKLKIGELFNRLVIWRARFYGMFHKDRLKIVLVRSSREARDKILDYLYKRDGAIGNIWFDSHGYYVNGYSSFTLGKDQFSYKTINDTVFIKYLKALAPYCDQHTRIAIGSCYGGATFEKPAHDDKPASRMNGDSLMIGMANVFPQTLIFGTESWVMTKPGIFTKNSFALAGYPLGKRFKKPVYRPVWERMGIWHCYSTSTGVFETVNTLSLSRAGGIQINSKSYLDLKDNQEKLEKILWKIDNKASREKQRQHSSPPLLTLSSFTYFGLPFN